MFDSCANSNAEQGVTSAFKCKRICIKPKAGIFSVGKLALNIFNSIQVKL